MDKNYLNELDNAYQKQMEEINTRIDKQVREEYQNDVSRNNSSSTQSTFWNNLAARFTNSRQAERDQRNTQNANEDRKNNLEQQIQAEINLRSEEQAKARGAEIFEDFGGSREAAFEKLKQYEEIRKEEIRDKAKYNFNESAKEKKEMLLLEDNTQRQLPNHSEKSFSNLSQQKQEAIQGQAQEAFNETSSLEEQEQSKDAKIEKQADATIEIKVPEKEQSTPSLDDQYWKKIQQTEAQMDHSNLITTDKSSSHDAQIQAKIDQSFSHSKSLDQGASI
ncbi:MAG: hypothetical protein AAFO07_29025 [Bacteroidota bacterium]